MPRLPSLAFLVALIAASPVASADVLSVRADGTGDFDSLATAVLFSQDGDVLLLDGDFSHEVVVISGRGLVVAPEPGATASVGALTVRNLAPGRTAVLRGLQIGPPPADAPSGTALTAWEGGGPLIVEDCVIVGRDGLQDPQHVTGGAALYVAGASAGVNLVRSTLRGGDGVALSGAPDPELSPVGVGGPALITLHATVSVHDSTLLGGAGAPAIPGWDGGHGGRGVTGYDATVFVEGSLVQGGVGGDGCTSPDAGCNGGLGVRLRAPMPQFLDDGELRTRDATIAGGAGGALAPPLTGHAAAGIDVQAATFAYSGDATHAQASAPFHTGDTASLSVQGTPGHSALWFAALDLKSQLLSGNKGLLLVDFPLLGPYALGTIPASGEAGFQFTAPSLAGTGVEHLTLHVQALVIGGGALRFGGPTAVVHLGDLP